MLLLTSRNGLHLKIPEDLQTSQGRWFWLTDRISLTDQKYNFTYNSLLIELIKHSPRLNFCPWSYIKQNSTCPDHITKYSLLCCKIKGTTVYEPWWGTWWCFYFILLIFDDEKCSWTEFIPVNNIDRNMWAHYNYHYGLDNWLVYNIINIRSILLKQSLCINNWAPVWVQYWYNCYYYCFVWVSRVSRVLSRWRRWVISTWRWADSRSPALTTPSPSVTWRWTWWRSRDRWRWTRSLCR